MCQVITWFLLDMMLVLIFVVTGLSATTLIAAQMALRPPAEHPATDPPHSGVADRGVRDYLRLGDRDYVFRAARTEEADHASEASARLGVPKGTMYGQPDLVH